MNIIDLNQITNYVEQNIDTFHQKRTDKLNILKLKDVLKRKNPYLYKAKNILTSEEIIRNLLNAHISSNEETLFGDWLEGLAIFVNKLAFGGIKSGIPGIDLEFEKENKRFIVSIKSGPNWGNSGQIKQLKTNFTTAKKTLRTSNSQLEIVAVNGCCYGIENNPDKGEYYKFCGQSFWEFISGDPSLYTDIIEPLGYKAKEKNENFQTAYAQIINKFTKEFNNDFCNDNGLINWKSLVEFNSSK